MEKNWVCVYTTEKVYLAEIAKEVLFENRIQAVTLNKRDSNYLFGFIEIYVDRNHAVKAKRLLNNMENPDSQNPSDQEAYE